jgi:hypothetical protein
MFSIVNLKLLAQLNFLDLGFTGTLTSCAKLPSELVKTLMGWLYFLFVATTTTTASLPSSSAFFHPNVVPLILQQEWSIQH